MSRIVFVTGATAGFGAACAEKFAANGYDVIINGRREERLQSLQQRLESEYKIRCHILPFDVRSQQDTFTAIEQLPTEWKNIDVLVNNAGLAAGRDYFHEGNVEDWDTMIDTNVKGLLYVSKAVAPLMVSRKKGHIINVGSVAAKVIYEKGNVYCATKAAVDALTQGMRIDLLRYNIKVTAIHPGAAETEFSLVRFKGDEATAASVYKGYQPLTANDVADVIYYTTTLPAHVCINDLVLSSTQQADSIHFHKEL